MKWFKATMGILVIILKLVVNLFNLAKYYFLIYPQNESQIRFTSL